MTTTTTAADDAVDCDALRRACRDLGLGETVADALLGRLLAPPAPTPVIDPVAHERMLHREAEMMRLLHTTAADKLIHDLRNLLNEVALLKAAADL